MDKPIETQSIAIALNNAAQVIIDFCERNHGIITTVDGVIYPENTPVSVKKIRRLATDLLKNDWWIDLPEQDDSKPHALCVAAEFTGFSREELEDRDKVIKQIKYLQSIIA